MIFKLLCQSGDIFSDGHFQNIVTAGILGTPTK